MNKRIETALGWPSLVVGLVLAIGTIMGWFGFRVATPEDSLMEHVREYEEHVVINDSLHLEYNEIVDTVHVDLHQQQTLMRALVIRSCLRDDYAELVLQQLLPTCEALGVHREPESRGVREIIDSIG